jgi:hypothetical protein
MKVFMSWSGDRSREVAKLLHYWIKCVVQASHPWISTSGIDSGSIWFNQINSELQDTTFGIICLTKENKDAPWILFEAGALAKGLASSRVCTFLIDLETKDIRDPLAQFNHTLPNYESVWKLVSTLNSSLAEVSRLDVTVLKGVFETYWPQFQKKFDDVLKTYPETTVVPPRKEKDILSDILESTRGLERRMRAIENGQNRIDHLTPKNFPENLLPISAKAHRSIYSDPILNDAIRMVRANIDLGASFDQAVDEARKAFSLSAKGVAELTKLALSPRNDDAEQ